MAVTAPPRPPRVPGFDESEQLEALIKEARRRARLRRLRYASCVLLAASGGTVAVLGPGRGGGGGTAAPEPSPATASEIKLAGARLAYVPVGGSVLYVTKPDGSGSWVLARCDATAKLCQIRNPVWSPDGRRIAFLRGRPQSRKRAGDLALYVIGLDGRGERRLAECAGTDGACGTGKESRLSWSPDGSQIALSRGGNVSIVNVESARVRQLTRCGRGCLDVDPAWSPDQRAIAFTRVLENERAGEVYRVSVSRPHLTSLAIYGRSPKWAPDGRTVLVETLEGMVRMPADGSQSMVTAPLYRGDMALASSSPDGSRLLYLSNPYIAGPPTEVWTMRPNGTGKKRLYRGSCCLTKPVWSGDGTRVAFSASDPFLSGSPGATFVVHADGTRLRKLARLWADLAWQPTHERTQAAHR